MGRTGIAPEEAPGLARTLARQCPDLYLEGVFTHLAVGFEADGEAFTREQLGRFTRTVEQIASVLGRMPELVHCASSGAILAHPECWLSMVRTGTLGYGYYPLDCPVRPIPLAPALSFHTRVAYVKRVAAGASIGYGRTWTAPRDTWIATLPVGYADGFSRLLSNRGRVLVAGRSCPVVGLVCMDQTMVDLGPETRVRAGDEVVLIGRSGDQEITLYELAKAMGTVPCDVACQIGRRVERITIPQVFTGRGLTGARPAS